MAAHKIAVTCTVQRNTWLTCLQEMASIRIKFWKMVNVHSRITIQEQLQDEVVCLYLLRLHIFHRTINQANIMPSMCLIFWVLIPVLYPSTGSTTYVMASGPVNCGTDSQKAKRNDGLNINVGKQSLRTHSEIKVSEIFRISNILSSSAPPAASEAGARGKAPDVQTQNRYQNASTVVDNTTRDQSR